MKIGIDISQIAYAGTGVASYTRSIVEAMVKADPGSEFILFGSSLRLRKTLRAFVDSLKNQSANGKNVSLKSSFLPPKLLETLWNGVHLVNIENFTGGVEVFHTSDWLEPPSTCPKVTTIHDLAIFKYPETFTARGGHDIVANQKRKLHFVKQETDVVIAVSENTKKDIVEILGINDKKIRVVYEAADPIFCRQDDRVVADVMRKYGLSGQYLLCVGTREPRKNIDRVLMAFSELSRAYPELQLAIAGKYGWGEDLAVTKTGKVKVLGFVPQNDLVALYSGAAVYVFPSLYEGFGLPILEAMSCGCPVVTSNLGSMKEVAGDAAILVDPNQPEDIAAGISKILRNQKTRAGLVSKSEKRANEFSWQKAALETLNIYHELVSNS